MLSGFHQAARLHEIADPVVDPQPAITPVVTLQQPRRGLVDQLFLSLPPTMRDNGLIIAVLAGFGLTTLVVPLMTSAAVGDDWVYARSVEILVREGRLHILDLSVVTLVFQVLWGALFATLFGLDFGVLRLSTVVMTMFGGLACYGLCRELTIPRRVSALAAAAYLFHPLSFVLTYSFMSDPHFTALLVIATYGYVKGLRLDRPDPRALLFGATVAACAFLVRQQGALIPPAVLLALLLQRRLRWDRSSLWLTARVAGIPALAIGGYYLWLSLVHGVPEQQSSFAQSVLDACWEQTLLLVGRMTFIEAMYVGFFALPLVVAALGGFRGVLPVGGSWVWGVVLAWALMLAAGLLHFFGYHHQQPPMPRMPYVAQYLGPGGLGPNDLLGGRSWLVSWAALDVLTVICAVSSLIFALLLARQFSGTGPADPSRSGAGIVLVIAVAQVAGTLPPSFHFRNWIISVDRYLLPLLPLTVCLACWALRGLRPSLTAAWVIVALSALISVAGTRDFLQLQGATWDIARAATAGGVPFDALDAGAAWDGYFLYEYSVAHGLDQQTPGGPWWTDLFGPATTSEYVVSTVPLPGYEEIYHVELENWLDGRSTLLYFLHRAPPAG